MIGFDVLLPARETYVSLNKVKNKIAKKDFSGIDREKLVNLLKKVSDSDAKFADAIRRSKRTVLTYFERCITFQYCPPPPDWDGVFAMRTK